MNASPRNAYKMLLTTRGGFSVLCAPSILNDVRDSHSLQFAAAPLYMKLPCFVVVTWCPSCRANKTDETADAMMAASKTCVPS